MNGGMVGGDGGLHIRVPMALKRRGGRKEIVVSAGLPRRAKSALQPHSALALAVVRGHRWKELLESGRYPSIHALAARMGVGSSYVGRHLNLALLAPDIVAAILLGQEPDGLSLEKLYAAPMAWEEQREVLGVAWHGVARTPVRRGEGLGCRVPPSCSSLRAVTEDKQASARLHGCLPVPQRPFSATRA